MTFIRSSAKARRPSYDTTRGVGTFIQPTLVTGTWPPLETLFMGHGQQEVADEGGVRLPLWCTGAACTDPRQPAEELMTDDMSPGVYSR